MHTFALSTSNCSDLFVLDRRSLAAHRTPELLLRRVLHVLNIVKEVYYMVWNE